MQEKLIGEATFRHLARVPNWELSPRGLASGSSSSLHACQHHRVNEWFLFYSLLTVLTAAGLDLVLLTFFVTSVCLCGHVVLRRQLAWSCFSPVVSPFAHWAIFEVQGHSSNFICLLFFPVPVREQKGGLAQDGGLEQLKSTICSVESTVAWGKEKADDEVWNHNFTRWFEHSPALNAIVFCLLQLYSFPFLSSW